MALFRILISTSNDQLYDHKFTVVTVCTGMVGMSSSRKNCQAIDLQSIKFVMCLTNM